MSWLSRILRRRPELIAFQGARVNLHCWYCAKQIIGPHTSVVKNGQPLRVHSECRNAATALIGGRVIEDNEDYRPIG